MQYLDIVWNLIQTNQLQKPIFIVIREKLNVGWVLNDNMEL